jgi:hypothetical protein
VNRVIIPACAAALLLSGCISMTPARYMVSPDVKEALAKYQGAHANVASIEEPAEFNALCRAVGNLMIQDGMTVAQFVRRAFNDELRYAGLHADNGRVLTGALTRAEFSSSAGLVNGWWELSVRLDSTNGKSLAVSVRHDFESGFNGFSACNQTGLELGNAVRLLIAKAVADPQFAALLK